MAYETGEGFDMNSRPPNHRSEVAIDAFKHLSPVPIEDLTTYEFYIIRANVLLWMQRQQPNPTYVKTHCVNAVVDGIPIIPIHLTNKALYIARDPRDIAVSFADHLGDDIDTVIEKMNNPQYAISKESTLIQPLMTWSMHVASWTRDTELDRVNITYEDILRQPKLAFKSILEFFEIPFDEQRFNSALKQTNFKRLSRQEDKKGYMGVSKHQEKFFRQGKIGKWKDVLTKKQRDKIEKDHGEMMEIMGYLN